MIRGGVKLVAFFLLLMNFVLGGAVLERFSRDEQRRRRVLAWTTWYSKTLQKIFGIHVKVDSDNTEVENGRNFLVVANHLSYLDILVIFTTVKPVFVTSVEIRDKPVLGLLCRLAGCYFVERRRRTNLSKEILDISHLLSDGYTVVLFPEATSTNGAGVKPFKKSLFTAAIEAGVDLLPLCINYTRLDGETVTTQNRDRVFWYGDMPFFSHFFNMLRLKIIEVELCVLPSYQGTKHLTRNELSSYAFKLISSRYRAIA